MSCKGICLSKKVKRPIDYKRYDHGQKRCMSCNVFMIESSPFCPCCGKHLRTKSRNKRSARVHKRI